MAEKKNMLRRTGKSESAKIKQEIQSVLRSIVMVRDGGCILRDKRGCGAVLGHYGVVFQADHLISRANSATYADSRLVVCVCKSCHGWKSLGGNRRKAEYDEMVKSILPPKTVALWEKAEKESWRPHRKYTADWKLALVALLEEYKKVV